VRRIRSWFSGGFPFLLGLRKEVLAWSGSLLPVSISDGECDECGERRETMLTTGGVDSPQVRCVAVAVDLDLVVSGGGDGTLLFHSLRRAEHLHSLQLPDAAPPDQIAVAQPSARVVVFSHRSLTLYTYTITGRLVAAVETGERVHALAVTADGRFVVTGGEKCALVVREIHNLKVHRRMETMASPITGAWLGPRLGWLLPGVQQLRSSDISASMLLTSRTASRLVLRLMLGDHSEQR
jgi:hypothetical protein